MHCRRVRCEFVLCTPRRIWRLSIAVFRPRKCAYTLLDVDPLLLGWICQYLVWSLRCLVPEADHGSRTARSKARSGYYHSLDVHRMVSQCQFQVAMMRQSMKLQFHLRPCSTETYSRLHFVALQGRTHTLSSVECNFGTLTAGLHRLLNSESFVFDNELEPVSKTDSEQYMPVFQHCKLEELKSHEHTTCYGNSLIA